MRILLFDLQRMVREIIEEAVTAQPALELVAASAETSLTDAVEATDADAVINGADDPALAARLLERRPQLAVLAVVDDGRQTLLYRLRPHREELGELSADAMVGALRRASDHSEWLP